MKSTSGETQPQRSKPLVGSFKIELLLFSLRRFLEAGKHVCVEYPMVLSYNVATELMDQAKQKGERIFNSKIRKMTQ